MKYVGKATHGPPFVNTVTSWPVASTWSMAVNAAPVKRAVQAAVDVELHRRPVERRAVLELDAVTQVHRPLRVVRVVLDGLDEVGHGLAVLVIGEQASR